MKAQRFAIEEARVAYVSLGSCLLLEGRHREMRCEHFVAARVAVAAPSLATVWHSTPQHSSSLHPRHHENDS